MVSVDPLKEPGVLFGRLDLSHFWCGIDTSLADRWSTGSRPSLFLPPRGRLHLVELALLLLRRRVRLGERSGANRSTKWLRLRRLERMESVQLTDWGLSSAPKALMGVRRPKHLLRV